MEHLKKKILWFTHTDAGYEKIFKNKDNVVATGTWIETIANKIKTNGNIELAIAFRSKYKNNIREKEGVKYFPIYIGTSNSRIARVYDKAILKVSWYDEIDKYKTIIDEFKPDLIHVFGSEENFGFISKFTNVPVVLSIQGNLTVYKWKYFSGLTKFELFSSFNFKRFIRFSTDYNNYLKFKKKAAREREILKNINFIIGRTDWDRRLARILAPNAVYFSNEEVLRDQFYNEPKVCFNLNEKIIITTISGPAIYKGLETVCKSITILNDLNIDFEWNIIGVDGSENLIKAIKKKLGKDFPEKNFRFLGKLSELAIIDILKTTNIYVLPSHIENSPLSLSEAMVLGLPIICTYVGGTSSRITDKEEGLLIQSGDPWSMSGAILELKDNYQQALLYGEKARQRALDRHNVTRIVYDLDKIYSEII